MKEHSLEKKHKKDYLLKLAKNPMNILDKSVLDDIRKMINETRLAIAVTVNAGMTMLYWRIGRRIKDEILQGKRANYGQEIVATLSQQLSWTQKAFAEKAP